MHRKYVYQNGNARFFKEVVVTKVMKKTHPGTVVSLIVVGVVACLVLVFFCF